MSNIQTNIIIFLVRNQLIDDRSKKNNDITRSKIWSKNQINSGIPKTWAPLQNLNKPINNKIDGKPINHRSNDTLTLQSFNIERIT